MEDKKSKPSELKNWANLSRSILNGVVGDYLDAQHNPLAINMAFYNNNKPLVLDDTLSAQLDKPLSNKLVVLVHGLTNLETVWDIKSERADETADNYGIRFQNEFGFTPFYLRYNTGLAVLENGQKFDEMLSELVSAYPVQVDEIMLVGFSMGGLLLRSAQKHASENNNSQWLSKLTDCFYIGTPHEGSPLEKFGHLTSSVVRMVPKDYVKLWADWIDVRSDGIKDLREGLLNLHVADEKPQGARKESYEQSVQSGSFYNHAKHYFVSGAVSEDKDSLVNKVIGDSLVKKSSANPSSAPKGSESAHFDGLPHIPLAHSERVYQQLKQWVEARNTSVELKHFANAGLKIKENEPEGLSNQEILSGCMDLLATAYHQTVSTVETMHYSISDEPFSILKKTPIVSDASQSVEVVHKEILDTIYCSLKTGGKLVDSGLKLLKPDRKSD